MNAHPRRDQPSSTLHLLDPTRAGAAPVASHRIALHGQPMHYLESGRRSGGPVVVLLHGLASNAGTWSNVLPLLGRHAHVLAPDLLGSGDSAKPRAADYSVGGHAARLRDLLRELGLECATLVGHSFGGGVAMSFAYQFPERTEGLGLIASGGLGAELNVVLRMASLPGTVSAANNLTALSPWWLRQLARQVATRLGLAPSADLDAVARALRSLADRGAREAFVQTLRGAVSWSGQRLAASDRFYLLAELPILLVAGRRDSCIPHRHTVHAHRLLPGSRLELLDVGHFPHQECPDHIVRLLVEFLTGAGAHAAEEHPVAG
jgi:pimeloyl-ACP methyl ester carboxylesterase